MNTDVALYETRLGFVTESCLEFESVHVSGIELLQVPMTDILTDMVLHVYMFFT